MDQLLTISPQLLKELAGAILQQCQISLPLAITLWIKEFHHVRYVAAFLMNLGFHSLVKLKWQIRCISATILYAVAKIRKHFPMQRDLIHLFHH
jgi:hypothetical protein